MGGNLYMGMGHNQPKRRSSHPQSSIRNWFYGMWTGRGTRVLTATFLDNFCQMVYESTSSWMHINALVEAQANTPIADGISQLHLPQGSQGIIPVEPVLLRGGINLGSRAKKNLQFQAFTWPIQSGPREKSSSVAPYKWYIVNPDSVGHKSSFNW